jgi:hypothetical protein
VSKRTALWPWAVSKIENKIFDIREALIKHSLSFRRACFWGYYIDITGPKVQALAMGRKALGP